MALPHDLTDSLGNKVRRDAYVIRATELGQFINCPRNWMFASHNGFNLESVVRPQKLRFGIVWHAGLEALYDGRDPMVALTQEFDKEVRLIYDVAAYDPLIKAQIEEERALAEAMMHGYIRWKDSLATPPDTSFTPQGVERRILVRIEGTTGYLAVRLDAEVVDRSGGLWILEHKTRGKTSSVDNPPELQLDLQMGLQIYALEQATGRFVKGAYYNLARKQMPSAKVKTPLFGRHAVQRSKSELLGIQMTLENAYYDMRRASNVIEKDPERALLSIRYNPQPVGLCQWMCSVKDICESINRREDVGYLIRKSLKPRSKTIWETLAEELPDN